MEARLCALASLITVITGDIFLWKWPDVTVKLNWCLLFCSYILTGSKTDSKPSSKLCIFLPEPIGVYTLIKHIHCINLCYHRRSAVFNIAQDCYLCRNMRRVEYYMQGLTGMWVVGRGSNTSNLAINQNEHCTAKKTSDIGTLVIVGKWRLKLLNILHLKHSNLENEPIIF